MDRKIRGQVYIQEYKVKKIDKQKEKTPTIRFWDEKYKESTQKDHMRNMVSQTAEKIEYTYIEATTM